MAQSTFELTAVGLFLLAEFSPQSPRRQGAEGAACVGLEHDLPDLFAEVGALSGDRSDKPVYLKSLPKPIQIGPASSIHGDVGAGAGLAG
jgi:hypothetical protein